VQCQVFVFVKTRRPRALQPSGRGPSEQEAGSRPEFDCVQMVGADAACQVQRAASTRSVSRLPAAAGGARDLTTGVAISCDLLLEAT
jgi:hypothetical protein